MPAWPPNRIFGPLTDVSLTRLMLDDQKQVVQQVKAQIEPLVQALWQQPARRGIIHADLHCRNVLIYQDKGHLIDFGEIAKGILLWDLGVAVANLTIDYPDVTALGREELVKGYLSIRPKDALFIDTCLDDLVKLRVLEVLTRPATSWSDAKRANDVDVIHHINQVVDLLKGL